MIGAPSGAGDHNRRIQVAEPAAQLGEEGRVLRAVALGDRRRLLPLAMKQGFPRAGRSAPEPVRFAAVHATSIPVAWAGLNGAPRASERVLRR